MVRAALFGFIFAITSLEAVAAEQWLVMKDGADAWAYDKGFAFKDEATGATVVKLGRYHGTPQTDSAATYSFDFRNYRVDCTRQKVQQVNNERFNKTPAPVAPAALPAERPWIPMSFGWPLKAKQYVCDGTGLGDAIKAPSKIAAMATMMTIAEKGASNAAPAAPTAPAASTTVAEPSILDDKLCKDVRSILGQGQQERPAFNSFYASEAERQKYAGLGSASIDGFGECKIQRSAFIAGQPGKYFGMYYCTKTGLSEAQARKFAAEVSKRVGTCLQVGTLVEGNELGAVIKSYDHSLTMAGFPRVRVVHEKDHRVVINLDTPGR
jgi:hypothetical protein